jgi:ketopantoate reductase
MRIAIVGAGAMGTSMLAVLQLADLAGKENPTVRNIYACAALLNKNLLSMLEQTEVYAP